MSGNPPQPPARPTLFFDLDGPLLDVRDRYHGVYRTIAAELGVQPLDRAAYWAAKRQRVPLGRFFPGREGNPDLHNRYLDTWLARIEEPEWLRRDAVVPGAFDCLEQLSRSYALYLVTLRRNTTALAEQLELLGLQPYFDGVSSGWTEGSTTEAAHLKASWIRPLLSDAPSVLVGDTEVDMQAAQILGLRGVGVSFGIREPHDLLSGGASAVVDSLAELCGLLDHGTPD